MSEVRTHVFNTDNGDEQALVTVYPDGQVTLAFRSEPHHSWGVPLRSVVCSCGSCSPMEVAR